VSDASFFFLSGTVLLPFQQQLGLDPPSLLKTFLLISVKLFST